MNPTEQHTLLNIIAALLNTRGPWTVIDRDGYLRIASASGPSLWVRFDEYNNKGKLAVNVNWPLGPDGRENYPVLGARVSGINISYSKTPAQIAADIERRLLPAYLPQWDKQLAETNASAAYEAKRQANYDKVAAATGGKVTRREHDRQSAQLDWPRLHSLDKGYVHGVQVSADTMQFDVRSVPIEIGIAIINLVHGRKG